MNYVDIIIIVVLFAFGVGGLRKGIITEAATLLGLGLGLYGAFHFSDYTADRLLQWVEINPKYLNLISFIVTFIVVAILVNLLGRIVTKIVKSLNLGFIDKLGGFVFGIAKGILICSLLVMLVNVFRMNGIIKERPSRNRCYILGSREPSHTFTKASTLLRKRYGMTTKYVLRTRRTKILKPQKPLKIPF